MTTITVVPCHTSESRLTCGHPLAIYPVGDEMLCSKCAVRALHTLTVAGKRMDPPIEFDNCCPTCGQRVTEGTPHV